jgi:hypothetical protein
MNITKVQPYPFPITLMIKNTSHPAQVMKITNVGFICDPSALKNEILQFIKKICQK